LEVLFCSYNRYLTELDEEAFGFWDNPWTLREVQLVFFSTHFAYLVSSKRNKCARKIRL
jgi:hypothetical protein